MSFHRLFMQVIKVLCVFMIISFLLLKYDAFIGENVRNSDISDILQPIKSDDGFTDISITKIDSDDIDDSITKAPNFDSDDIDDSTIETQNIDSDDIDDSIIKTSDDIDDAIIKTSDDIDDSIIKTSDDIDDSIIKTSDDIDDSIIKTPKNNASSIIKTPTKQPKNISNSIIKTPTNKSNNSSTTKIPTKKPKNISSIINPPKDEPSKKKKKLRPIPTNLFTKHKKPTAAEMLVYQNVPIPFKQKMKCKGYHETHGTSFKQLWSYPSIRIFIGIWSMAEKYEIRHLIRTLYLKQKQNLTDDNVDFKFILGTPPESEFTPELKSRLNSENATYGDIVMLDITENMNNGKAYFYWKWVGENIDASLYDYAAKADDDVFIHFQNLALNLRPLSRSNLYYGYHSIYFIRGMLEVVSIEYTHLIASVPYNKLEWAMPEDHALGFFLIKYARSSLVRIGENCLFFTDPRVPSHDIRMPWASPDSIAIHWLKSVQSWKGVIDLYFPGFKFVY